MIEDSKKKASKKALKNLAFGAALTVGEVYFYLSPGDEREKRNVLKDRHRESEGIYCLVDSIIMKRC